MKRTLSLVLALVMVLGSFSTVFAADTSVEEKAAAFLNEKEVLVGNAQGDLMLGEGLKRQDAVILLSKLMGEFDTAVEFPTSETSPSYKDIRDKFYLPFLAWAQANKTFVGHNDAKFGFGEFLTAQEYASVLLRVLGYEVEWKETLEEAKALGLLADVEVENSTQITRGQMSVMTLNALATKIKDSTQTLAEKLEIELPAPELSTEIEVTAVAAIANNKVEVKVKEEVAASVADFTIVKKGSTTEVEIKDMVKESAKVFVLETEALVGGTSYTLTSNGKSVHFTGLSADTTAPTVKKLTAVDTNTFKVEFSDRMDFASATNVQNYKFNKDIKVVKATINADRTTVTLTTDAAKRNIVYTLTIEGVMNSDGKVITKIVRTITAIEDRIAPRVTTLKVQNNHMLIVEFSDSNGMDKAALETVENYSINDLEITSATAYDTNVDGLYETVVLMTADQTVNKSYTLTMNNLVDGSVLANALGKTTRGFRGASLDKTAPTVKVGSISSENNNTVDIEFNDNNAMDQATLEDISNYVITYGNNEVLPILSAEAWDVTYPDGYLYRGVTLTTAQQEVGKLYKIEVRGVQDEFGNALKPISGSTYAKYTFTGSAVQTQPPYVKEVKYINPTKIELHFNKQLTNALDPTSYVINKDLGAAIKVRFVPGTSRTAVELTTQEMKGNTTYTVTINDVQDRFGNEVVDAKATFVATATSLDVTAPSVTYVYAANKSEIHVNFDEVVVAPAGSTITVKEGNNSSTFSYVGMINDGTTLVYAASGLKDAEYTLTNVTNIKDAAGNNLTSVQEGTTFAGTTADNVAPEVEYVEQINTKTLKIVFNEPVKSTDPKMSRVNALTSPDDYVTEWYYKEASNFVVGKEITIALSAVRDLSNVMPKNEKFTPYYEDSVKPSITGVTATNNKTVVVTYDENITTGSYEIYRVEIVAGKDIKKHIYTGTGTVINGNQVRIDLQSELKGDYIYYLRPVTGARDIANNSEDTKNVLFDFPGTDVKVTSYITGVAINNAQTITVSASKTITKVTVYEGSTTGAVLFDGASTGKATLNVPVLEGAKYVVVINDDTDNPYEFEGITPDLGITLAKAAGSKFNLDFAGYTTELFKVAVLNANGDVVVAKQNVPVHGTAVAYNAANLKSDLYVVLYDKNDDTRVLYAAKVQVSLAGGEATAVENVKNLVANLGEVKAESKDGIVAAINAYNALDAELRALIPAEVVTQLKAALEAFNKIEGVTPITETPQVPGEVVAP